MHSGNTLNTPGLNTGPITTGLPTMGMDTGRITQSGPSADLKNDPAIREAYLGSI